MARLTDRPFFRGACRQLILGTVAAGLTYLIGRAVGSSDSGPAEPSVTRPGRRPGKNYHASGPNDSS